MNLGKVVRRTRRVVALMNERAQKVWSQSAARRASAERPAAGAAGGIGDWVVVITGSTKGLGRALAEGFAQTGARVVINGRDENRVRQTVHEFTSAGAKAAGIAADVSTAEGARSLIEGAVREFGRVDLLINNAGVAGPGLKPATEMELEEAADVIRVNTVGAFNCATIAARQMEAQGSGRIINVSSGITETYMPGAAPYAISKQGLEGVTAALAGDLAGSNIVVTTMRLSGVRTDMTKEAFGWAKAELLPDPKTMVAPFMRLATAPAELVQGRAFSAERLVSNPDAELMAQSPMAAIPPFRYPAYEFNGKPVRRGSGEFAIYDRAENPFGPSLRVAQALQDAIAHRPIAVYPDDNHSELRAALAEALGLPGDWFAIGNGSWELLDRLLETFTRPGDEVVSNAPGWFGFNMLTRKRVVKTVLVPFLIEADGNRHGHNLDAVAAATTNRTRLIYLISPANPEGIALTKHEFARFLSLIPPRVPVVVDEAYIEYADAPEVLDAATFVRESEHPIIGLRTFSKFYSLASMRVGYAFGRPEILTLLDRGERIFNLSAYSEIAALAALRDREHSAQFKQVFVSERKRLERGLGDLGLEYVPSQGPFMLIEIPGDIRSVCGTFAQKGIFLGEKAFYKNKFMLFPIARPEQNDKNLAILKSLV